MAYALRALGSQKVIDCQEAEYMEVRRAKAALVTIIGIEQKFDLLLANYIDSERELLDLSLYQALQHEVRWQAFQDDIATVSRRLANLLSAACLYLDQISHDLRSVFGDGSEVPDLVRAEASEEYDGRFGYRVMETLRNVMQHRSMPVHGLSYPHESVTDGLRIRAIPRIDVARLSDAGLKTSVLEELRGKGDIVRLTPLIREYVEGLGNVHQEVRALTASAVASWDSVVTSIHRRAVREADVPLERAVLAVRLDDAGAVVETVQLFTDLIEYRKGFERRNQLLSNLARRYVSSMCGHDDA